MILDYPYRYVVDYTGLPTMGKHYGHIRAGFFIVYIKNKPPYSYYYYQSFTAPCSYAGSYNNTILW